MVCRNFSTGSVQKKMDESCAGGKEIENRSIASNQEDGPNHDDGEQVNKEVRPVGGTHVQCLFAQPIAKRTDISNFIVFQAGNRKEAGTPKEMN